MTYCKHTHRVFKWKLRKATLSLLSCNPLPLPFLPRHLHQPYLIINGSNDAQLPPLDLVWNWNANSARGAKHRWVRNLDFELNPVFTVGLAETLEVRWCKEFIMALAKKRWHSVFSRFSYLHDDALFIQIQKLNSRTGLFSRQFRNSLPTKGCFHLSLSDMLWGSLYKLVALLLWLRPVTPTSR